ncbi:MAG: hypothetical protein COX62_07430 [Deltaproteobacteria bacterium CG_4_10_14_0_2_um_filter_43_8]|nr:MAG: hypothetical protein COV43_06175 [Deltaproteobacteria bacterium CG11_big_fil_rev_8_21_14_0_20_42_23]PJA19043.1 MAG: hypothetical protein COX62_07430 [Deltaproteobacteria bacterium CG_4_10_14_0_2_um_filter_43_8]PJC65179.1 MAG: hypothetical protein CO021_00570 [Deltaproteobacteria bacterium CG_4_9_14_0_2_um_filter_42_21]
MHLRKTSSLLLLLSVLLVQACGTSNTKPAETQQDNSQQSSPENDTSQTGDTTQAPADTEETPAEQNDPDDTAQTPAKPRLPDEALACVNLALAKNAVDIGTGLPNGYEPSGADWHSRLKKVFGVHDNGFLFSMNKDGNDVTTWNVGGDLEGITIPNPDSDFIYLGREFPAAILEFNIVSGTVTRTFSLGGAGGFPESSGQGLEALTFVEKEGNPEGGEFWAGSQSNGKVYVYTLPIASSSNSTTVTHIATLTPVPGRADLAGLDYSSEFDVVYVTYDGANKLNIVDPDNGSVYFERALPQTDQEGIAVNNLCDTFIAQDTNKKFWFYKGNEELAINTSTVKLLADRIAAAQNNNGSYDWKHVIDDPLTPESTGYQNVTGVSVWGLFNAIDLLNDETYANNIERAVNYFDGRVDALLADPHNANVNLSCPNYTVLSQYLQTHPNAALQTRVVSALNAILDARDSNYGTDASMRVDGIFNHLSARRVSLPGIIPWDMALCVEALKTMADISNDFANDYINSLSLLANYVRNTFLPVYDTDTTLTYADTSLSLPLYVFADSTSANLYSDVIADLTTRLESLIDENGMISNSSINGDGQEQPSAYGLIALKQINSAQVQTVQNFLESRIDDQGHIFDPTTREETYEVEGEVLRAIAMQ